MGLAEFFETSSPFAYQDITARMLETVRKGYWKADEATERRLLEQYVASVNAHGVGCAEHTCGNPRLQKYVLERGIRAGIPVPAMEGFQRAMERATGEAIDPAAGREEAFSRDNDARMAARLEEVPAPSRLSRELEGYLMEERDRATQARNEARQDGPPNPYVVLWTSLPVLGLLVAWRWRRRRA
jgi:cobaltochelatase CobN